MKYILYMTLGILLLTMTQPNIAITKVKTANINQLISDIKTGKEKDKDKLKTRAKQVTKGVSKTSPLVEELIEVAMQAGIPNILAEKPSEVEIAPKEVMVKEAEITEEPITKEIEKQPIKHKVPVELPKTEPVTVKPSAALTTVQAPTITQLQPGVSGEVIVFKMQEGAINALNDTDKQNYLGTLEQIVKNPGASNSIFDMLLKYQWPTNLLFVDSFSAQEKDTLFTEGSNPENFIRNKIQQTYPQGNYNVMSIPDTIYQLFIINYYLTHLDNPTLHEMDGYLFKFFDEFQTSTNEDAPYVHLSAKKDFLNASKAIYNNPCVARAHFIINCAFGDYYTSKPNWSWQQIAVDLISQIIANYPKNKGKIPFHGEHAKGFDLTRLGRELQGKNLTQNGIVDNLLKLESETQQKNKAILMRAVSLFQQHIEVNGKDQLLDILDSSIKFSSIDDLREKYHNFDLWTRGNSYGLFPFTGAFYCIYDMPYYYALTIINETTDEEGKTHITETKSEDLYFYALPIDKTSYLHGQVGNLFLIPPFSALTQLWGHDSLYHILSRIAQDPIPHLEHNQPWLVEGFEPVLDPYNILFIKMDPLLFASQLADFVSNNAVLLKISSKAGMSIQTEQARLRKNLEQASKFYRSLATKVGKSPEKQRVHVNI
ncbi:MAG TPA: hypothetical protein VGW78_02375 [Candidatus Babeliales bacterium]|nr:hypothetical protein [Candidatus Babeliales bacterium]